MCGIAGILHYRDRQPVQATQLARMSQKVAHRGPNADGTYIEHHLGFAHRRLSIIDLSEHGRQPMFNEDGTVAIIFNGEIYNYQELKRSLKLPHTFKNATDTEAIIHGFEEEGIAIVNRLEGMFAFALWDSRTQELFLVRDRVGEKPLVYADLNGTLLFASEIPAILAGLPKMPEIDEHALHHYFTHVYFTPPHPLTIFKGIKKLPPAHFLKVDANGHKTLQPYWNPSFEPKTDAMESEMIETYRRLLEQTVEKQMISDVPLGVLLSGGVDSSSIVAMMRKIGTKEIRSYAIGVGDHDPELDRARRIATQFSTIHKECIFTPSDLQLYPELLEYLGEPINLLPILYSHKLMRMMKPEVTVALTGSGGDEVFGGYDYYRETLILDRIAAMEHHLPELADRAFRQLLKGLAQLPVPKQLQNLPLLCKLLSIPLIQRKSFLYRRSGAWALDHLYTSVLADRLRGTDPGALIDEWFAKTQSSSYLEAVMMTDLMIGNTPSLVTLGDLSGMGIALETRSPLLSHRLIEFAATLPLSMKVHSIRDRRTNKYIMKRAMEGLLPHDLLYEKKMGFGYHIRWGNWFRNEWKNAAERILFSRSLPETGWFEMSAIRTMMNEHVSGKRDHATTLMGLLVFDLWFERFVLHRSQEELISLLS